MADPQQYEFSADEEQAMRRRSSAERASPTQLARVAKEFEPEAAQEAREVAARRVPARRHLIDRASRVAIEGAD